MRFYTTLLLFLCAGTIARIAEAGEASAPDLAAARKVCDQFMTAISKGRVAEAAGVLKANWYKPEEADAVAMKFEADYRTEELRLEGESGKRLGAYELLGTRRWGKSAVKFVCVQKHEYSAVVWVIACYHGVEGWKLAAFLIGPQTREDTVALQTDAPAAEFAPQRQLAERFLALLAASLPNEAFAELKKGPWANPEAAAFSLVKLEDQYRSGSAAIKKEIGVRIPGAYEFVAGKQLGDSVLNLFYNEKREQGFLMWQITFYRAEKEWKFEAVTFGGDVPVEQRSGAALSELNR